MKIVIFIAAVCLLIVLGGQIYCLFTLDEAGEKVLTAGSISGRLDCGDVEASCCAQGPRVLLNFPAGEQASAQIGMQGEREIGCGEFFHFDPVKPGRHTLYVEYRLKGEETRQFREVAALEVASGTHGSVGTVRLSRE